MLFFFGACPRFAGSGYSGFQPPLAARPRAAPTIPHAVEAKQKPKPPKGAWACLVALGWELIYNGSSSCL